MENTPKQKVFFITAVAIFVLALVVRSVVSDMELQRVLYVWTRPLVALQQKLAAPFLTFYPDSAKPTIVRSPQKYSHIFDGNDLRVGDSVGNFEVEDIAYFPAEPNSTEPPAWSRIQFTGRATITGILHRPNFENYVPQHFCLSSIDDTSVDQLPSESEGEQNPWLCLSFARDVNQAKSLEDLLTAAEGSLVRVEINGLTLSGNATNVSQVGKLAEVVKVDPPERAIKTCANIARGYHFEYPYTWYQQKFAVQISPDEPCQAILQTRNQFGFSDMILVKSFEKDSEQYWQHTVDQTWQAKSGAVVDLPNRKAEAFNFRRVTVDGYPAVTYSIKDLTEVSELENVFTQDTLIKKGNQYFLIQGIGYKDPKATQAVYNQVVKNFKID